MLLTAGLPATAEAATGNLDNAEQPLVTLPQAEPELVVEYPYVCDKLSRKKIREFPVASYAMSPQELRQLCLDFFLFSKTFAWTPSEQLSYVRNQKGTVDTLKLGTVYGGLPYVRNGSGNVYRFMDYYDPETGVLDTAAAGEDMKLFGSQCSIGIYWAWGRVVNSARFGWTYDMVQSRGFLRVGPYMYDDSITRFGTGLTTAQICEDNGKQTMMESYATMQIADGLVYSHDGGHVLMCATEPVVERYWNGEINPRRSYIYFVDQAQSWATRPQSNGDPFILKHNIDTKITFEELYNNHYIPFTFAELLGEDMVEDLSFDFSHTGSAIAVQELAEGYLSSNYGISDIYISLWNSDDELICSGVKRMERGGILRTGLGAAIERKDWLPYAREGHTVEVVAQFSNGERLTVYSGTLRGWNNSISEKLVPLPEAVLQAQRYPAMLR